MFSTDCATWINVASVIYGSAAMDEVIFNVDSKGKVVSMTSPSLRVTLDKQRHRRSLLLRNPGHTPEQRSNRRASAGLAHAIHPGAVHALSSRRDGAQLLLPRAPTALHRPRVAGLRRRGRRKPTAGAVHADLYRGHKQHADSLL
ncbi:hypothetical protein NUW58_g10889 [Xylaria curta]|uniref:Uncharacterized protein n=1 Tax=Xylaria curta TaxID=42375 RepID=A0ACC1MFV4_9PEZI|nr:hypothetical protein NUW58_g10889 [Xylaria curta]